MSVTFVASDSPSRSQLQSIDDWACRRRRRRRPALCRSSLERSALLTDRFNQISSETATEEDTAARERGLTTKTSRTR